MSVVASADETIRRVDELSPDIVLVDADAPEPGLVLCRSLKQNPRTVLLPVVILGKSSRERVAALAAGADDFMSGDVSRELLQARIETLVRATAARRELAATQLGEEIRRRDDLRQMFRRYLAAPRGQDPRTTATCATHCSPALTCARTRWCCSRICAASPASPSG